MAKQLNVNLAFTADTTQAKKNILDLQNSLRNISSIGFNNSALTKDMEQAVASARQLQMHLNNAFNSNTGNFDLSKLNTSLKKSNTTIGQLSNGLLKAGLEGETAFMNLQNAIASSNIQLKNTNTLLSQMGTTLANTIRWQFSSSLIHGFQGAIQKAVGYAEDLDKSLNNIRIVTGQSADQMAKFAKEANKAAKELSTTTTKYTDASLIYYQQGLSDEEVKKRTDITVKMANVAGESVETVSDQLTAVWNNFDDGSKSLEYYADVMTALGAATASSVDEISGGLEKFAAIGDTIGLSFEYAASALATITSNTRQSEEVVGTALKTIFARIQGLKLGETQDDGTDLNKYSEALAKVGISIFESNGELKAMDNILDEMAVKWKSLNNAQQTALAQTVAGVRQYTQLVALMENWNNGDNDSMMANLNTSYGSTGALQEQADIYAESWEAAQARVKASLETLYNELIPTDFLVGATNAVSDILDVVATLVDGFGGISNILLLISTVALKRFSAEITTGIDAGLTKISSLSSAFENFSFKAKESTKTTVDFNQELDKIETAHSGSLSTSFKDLNARTGDSKNHIAQMNIELNKSAQTAGNLTDAFQQYLKDTNQVFSIQSLIDENRNKLTQSEQERLKIQQQELLTLAKQNKELQIQKEELDIIRDRELTFGDANALNKIKYDTDGKAYLNAKNGLSTNQQQNIANYGIEYNADNKTLTGDIQSAQINAANDYQAIIEANLKIKALLNDQGQITEENRSKIQAILPSLSTQEDLYQGIDQENGDIRSHLTEIETTAFNTAQILGNTPNYLKGIEAKTVQINSLSKRQNEIELQRKNTLLEINNILNQAQKKYSSISGVLSRSLSSFSSLAMNINMVSNAFKTLNDENADFGTIISSISFAAPAAFNILTTGINGAINGYKTLTSAMTIAGMKQKYINDLDRISTNLQGFINDGLDEERNLNAINNILEDIGIRGKQKEIVVQEILNNEQKKENKLTIEQILLNKIKNKQLIISLGKMALVVAAITAVVLAIKAQIKAQNAAINAEKEAKEQAQELNEKLKETQSAYDNLKSSIENYNKAHEALKTLKEDSAEWTATLVKANEEVLNLIKLYPELADKVKNVGNKLILPENAQEELLKLQLEKLQKAQFTANFSQITANEASINRAVDDYEIGYNRTIDDVQLQQEYTIISADILEKAAKLYSETSGAAFQSVQTIMDSLDLVEGQEELAKALWENSDKIQALSSELNKYNNSNDLFKISAIQSYLTNNNKIYDAASDEEKSVYAKLLSNTITTEILDNELAALSIYNEKELADKYKEFNNWEASYSKKDNKYTFTDGSTLDFNEQNARSQLAYASAIEKQQSLLQQYKSIIDQLNNLSAGAGVEFLEYAYDKENYNINNITIDQQKVLSGLNRDSLINYFNQLGVDNAEAYADSFSNALTEWNAEEALYLEEQKKIAKADEILETAASKFELNADELRIQASQLAKEYDLDREAAAQLAVENQLMNQGLSELIENWEDWSVALQSTDKTTEDYAKAASGLAKTITKLVGATEDLELPADFIDSPETLELVEKAARGDIDAINELGAAVGKATIDTLNFQNALVEFEDKDKDPIEFNLDDFENSKQTVLKGINELQQKIANGSMSVGDSIDFMGKNWVTELNKMALMTGMSVEQMNNLLSSLGVQTEVRVDRIKQQTAAPEYSVTAEGSIKDLFSGDGGYKIKVEPLGTKLVDDGYIEVPQIGTKGDVKPPKITYVGNGSVSRSNATAAASKASDKQSENFEKLQKALEFKLKIDDSELEKLEYLLNKYSDEFFLLSESMEKLLETIDNRKSILSIHKDHVKDLEKAYKSGRISQEDYLSGLEEAKSAIYEQLNALIDLDKQMKEYYENTLDQADEELEDHIDHLDHLTEVFEHYVNLMDIFGKSKDYEAMGNFLQGQADVTKDRLDIIELYYDSLIKEKAEVEKLLAEAIAQGDKEAEELYTIMLDNIVDKVDETQNEMLELTEEWAEVMKKVLENTFDKLADELEKALTNGIGFDEILNDFDLLNQSQEELLTKTNQVYETNKLMRTATKAMDDTSNKAAKQKIKNYIEETKKLQNNTKLSKYELEIQQAKYDLLLAEIALEEAQNAKSTVRLQRDSAGNFGYVYTADQDSINDAQQQLEDAENNLYNIQFEGQQNALTKLMEAGNDYKEAIETAYLDRASGEISSDEELNEKLSKLQQQYFGPNGILTNLFYLYNLTLQDQTNATAENWLNQYKNMILSAEDFSATVNQYIGQMDSAWNNFQISINQIHSSVQTDLNDSATATKNLTNESEKLADTIENTLLPEITKEIEEVRKATEEYALQREELAKLTKEYEDYIDTLNTKITKAASSTSGGNGDNEDDYDKGDILKKDLKYEEHAGEKFLVTDDGLQHIGVADSRKNTYNKDNLPHEDTVLNIKIDKEIAAGIESGGLKGGYRYDPWTGHYTYYNTGGYTGDWGPEGKLAVLHEKELVLNATDTSNILSAVSIIREIARDIDARASMSNLSLLTSAIGVHDTNQVLEQMVSIEASFPNATDRYEIEEAFNNLVNKAAQYANRKN